MQEDQTVSFDQMYYEPQTSWFQKIFVVYLIAVLIMTVYRVARIAWGIRKLRKLEVPTLSKEDSQFQAYWYFCHRRIESFRKLSHLTFLLSVLVLSMSITNALMGLAAVKTHVISASAERMAGDMTPFSCGIIVCIVLYCCSMFFDVLLERRKSKRNIEG